MTMVSATLSTVCPVSAESTALLVADRISATTRAAFALGTTMATSTLTDAALIRVRTTYVIGTPRR